MKALSPWWCTVLVALACVAGCKKQDACPELHAAAPSPPVNPPGSAPAPSPTASAAAAPARSAEASPLRPCRGDPPGPARPASSGPLHTWGTISYPAIATPWGIGGKAIPVIGFGDKNGGLRFDLSFLGPGSEPELSKLPLPRRGELQVVLHTPHGKVSPKCGDTEVGVWVGD